MTHYEILGISKMATDQEIKAAYRKLAMKHHPDRGGDEETFKKIKEAYETLSDPNKRQMYDMGSTGRRNQHGGFNFEFNSIDDIDELLRRHFGHGGFHGFRQHRKNKDLRIRINLDLKDTLTTTFKNLKIEMTDGTEEMVEIKIPRGAMSGMNFIFEGRGDNFIKDLPRGNLLVQLNVIIPQSFSIANYGIMSSIQIDLLTALTGGKVEFVNFDDKKYEIEIPPGTNDGTKIKLPGLGIYEMDSFVRGDLYLSTVVDIPKITDDEKVKKLKEILQGQ